jgi:hypothetical protein
MRHAARLTNQFKEENGRKVVGKGQVGGEGRKGPTL